MINESVTSALRQPRCRRVFVAEGRTDEHT